MNPLAWMLRSRNLAYLFVAAVLLGAIGLLLTFLISDGQKVAARAVLSSADVERSVGPAGSALLIGSSFKFSGTFGCEEFRYLVFGSKGTAFVQTRLESGGEAGRKWKVLEVIEGRGADFNKVCWQKKEG